MVRSPEPYSIGWMAIQNAIPSATPSLTQPSAWPRFATSHRIDAFSTTTESYEPLVTRPAATRSCGTSPKESSIVSSAHSRSGMKSNPLRCLSYYACHPQSYYRTGVPSPDFPGIARIMRGQDVPDVLHVHFNGAGGNIGAGKYNDGAKENRMILATRVATGMKGAFEASERFPITADELTWTVEPVALPPAKHLDADKLRSGIAKWDVKDYWGSPDELAWLLRCQSGHNVDLACLSVGRCTCLAHAGRVVRGVPTWPPKPCVPICSVAMAAYGDYGPGYIGTEVAYGQGGYETSETSLQRRQELRAGLDDRDEEAAGSSGMSDTSVVQRRGDSLELPEVILTVCHVIALGIPAFVCDQTCRRRTGLCGRVASNSRDRSFPDARAFHRRGWLSNSTWSPRNLSSPARWRSNGMPRVRCMFARCAAIARIAMIGFLAFVV